ncbi:MAG: hypothetical protein AB7U82_15635 [Blastocatellales bacterium]
MRALLEVIKFEIHYQLRSPFFLGALLVFALIHFLGFTGVINIDVGHLVAINSAYALLQNELVLFNLGMLPIVAFVATAITRNFLKDFSFQTSPCPTSRDLVNALRAEAPPEYQQLITDLFERIVLYDLQVDAATAREIDGGYEVTIEVTARQFAADGRGKETEEPLDSWFDVAVFAETDKPLEEVTPLYIEKHRLRSGKQVLTVCTTQKPGIAALDPFHKMIERSAGNNSLKITALPITVSRLTR